MRWDGRQVGADDDAVLPGLGLAGLVRSVRTPEFAGVTFHEVLARTAINRVAAPMPFRWSLNPMRGCLHGCAVCYARRTHEFLDLGPGEDFSRQVVVKTNVAEVLRAELARPSWAREHVAVGTISDPYQRAEGRYRLMPDVVAAFADGRTPFSVTTRGTLLRRDLPLLAGAAMRVAVGVNVSLGLLDERLARALEPGAPSPRARLDLVAAVRARGARAAVAHRRPAGPGRAARRRRGRRGHGGVPSRRRRSTRRPCSDGGPGGPGRPAGRH